MLIGMRTTRAVMAGAALSIGLGLVGGISAAQEETPPVQTPEAAPNERTVETVTIPPDELDRLADVIDILNAQRPAQRPFPRCSDITEFRPRPDVDSDMPVARPDGTGSIRTLRMPAPPCSPPPDQEFNRNFEIPIPPPPPAPPTTPDN